MGASAERSLNKRSRSVLSRSPRDGPNRTADEKAPIGGLFSVLVLIGILPLAGFVPVHAMSRTVNGLSGFFVHAFDQHKTILAFVRPLAEGFVGKASMDEGNFGSVQNVTGNVEISFISFNSIFVIGKARRIDGQPVIAGDSFNTDILERRFWKYGKPALILFGRINTSKLLISNEASSRFFPDISIIDNYFRWLMQRWYGHERGRTRGEPCSVGANHGLFERFITTSKNSQLAIKNGHSDQSRDRDGPSTNDRRPISDSLFILCGIILAIVSSKMAYKATEWSSYRSILFLLGGFPIFFVAVCCLIYGAVDLLLPSFWHPHGYLLTTANNRAKDISNFSVVIAEVKVGNAQRCIFGADLMDQADSASVEFSVAPGCLCRVEQIA